MILPKESSSELFLSVSTIMDELVLVTGATGYVATRLIPELLARGYRVRCLARRPEKLQHRSWFNRVEVVRGDVLEAASLVPALENVQYAYYLIHNMISGSKYRENEAVGAKNFGEGAARAGVTHIIYLGGLGGSSKFRHMRSREETGRILRQSGVPVTEFRTSVVIGSGSISFELIRYFTTLFPFIPAPIQTDRPGQPIGVKNLLEYLTLALVKPECRGRILEIGGLREISYPDMMAAFAKIKNIHRPILPLPFFSPSLSAWIADKLTPVPYSIARPLMEELTSASVVRDHSALELFQEIELIDYEECVRYALARREYESQTPWLRSLLTRDPIGTDNIRTMGEGLLIEFSELNQEEWLTWLNAFGEGKINNRWVPEAEDPATYFRVRSTKQSFGKLLVEVLFNEGTCYKAAYFEPQNTLGFLGWWLSHRHRVG